MPRRARVILPGTPLHLIQRGNNRSACFFDDQDYQFYLEWLAEYARDTGCSVHSYVLMTNHVQLLVSGKTSRSVGDMMKRLGPLRCLSRFLKAIAELPCAGMTVEVPLRISACHRLTRSAQVCAPQKVC